MKRVILFDAANATLSDVHEMCLVAERRREEILQEKRHALVLEDAYKTLTTAAAQAYNKYKNYACYTKKEALTTALSEAYDTIDKWIELNHENENIECTVDGCYYTGNEDRIGSATFYFNVFSDDVIICDVCSRDNDAFGIDRILTPEQKKRVRRDVRKAAAEAVALTNKKSKTK